MNGAKVEPGMRRGDVPHVDGKVEMAAIDVCESVQQGEEGERACVRGTRSSNAGGKQGRAGIGRDYINLNPVKARSLERETPTRRTSAAIKLWLANAMAMGTPNALSRHVAERP